MKKFYNKKFIIISIMSLLFIMLFSIKVYATEKPFTLEKDSIDVKLNGTKFISYEGGSGKTTWKSSDTSVATISDTGLVSGLKIGTTTITATRGEETDTCIVNVIYNYISIGTQYSKNVNSLNLILNEHDTENLKATVVDNKRESVEGAAVTWSSSDESVVTVNQNGTLKGLKTGTATITAKAAGVEDTCKVTVYNGPVFTDFSNAKYELLFDTDVDLKITGITPKENSYYQYIITPNNTKPTLSFTSYGVLDTDIVTEAKNIYVNTEENYIYARYLDKYVELNQDLYLWVIENVKLEAYYTTEESTNVSYSSKFVVEGEKLTRPDLPQLNLILKSFYIWGGSVYTEEYSSIHFRFPTTVENRKFKIKIGKVTDNAILQKIQNNDYSGITSLLTYAKNNNAVYTADLTTTRECYFSTDKTLFDGLSVLDNKSYYYIYVEFDDENGKYYPIEGVTLGQAWVSSSSESWNLWAYTSENFEWNNLSNTPTETGNKEEKDNTTATGKLPQTGIELGIILIIITLLGTSVFVYYKHSKLKDI